LQKKLVFVDRLQQHNFCKLLISTQPLTLKNKSHTTCNAFRFSRLEAMLFFKLAIACILSFM